MSKGDIIKKQKRLQDMKTCNLHAATDKIVDAVNI